MVNHARRLSVMVYRMEAGDADYYESQLRLLERLHRELDEALASADRDRLTAVLTEQAGVFRSRIANVLGRKATTAFRPG